MSADKGPGLMTKPILSEFDPLLFSFSRSWGHEASAAILTVFLLAGLSVSCLQLSV